MRSAIVVILALLASSPASGYQNLKEAFRAPPADPRQGSLRREATQFILDSCKLKWTIGSPFALKDGPPLTALVSPDRNYCVLTRPYPCEGCDGARGAVALVDSSGLRWTLEGEFLAPSIVTNDGTVAMFTQAGSSPPYPGPLELLVVAASGDTIVTRRWIDRAYRPIVFGFPEVYRFSPDGRYLVLTMNLAQPGSHKGEGNNTGLYCYDLSSGTWREEKLGPFWPTSIDVSPEGATIGGTWRATLRLDEAFDKGVMAITWSPWKVEKRVTRTIPAFRGSVTTPDLIGKQVSIVVTRADLAEGAVRYMYRVVNRSTIPITAIEIGDDSQSGSLQLTTLPIGATADSIPPSCYTSPAGWEFTILFQEESSGHYLDWMRTAAAHEISGGDSLAGFSVILPEADSLYETGSWVAFMNDGEENTGILQRSQPRSEPSLLGATHPGLREETGWDIAEKSILRLPLTSFPQLPHKIQEWLMGRGFTIPQTFSSRHGPHNVISGAFERHGSVDWACLASRRDSSAIVVFFSGSTDRPIEIEWAGDRGYLQTYTADSIGYSRLISIADSARICDGFARDGQQPSVPVTHDGIEDAFIEKGSLILYYDNREWRPMGGSD